MITVGTKSVITLFCEPWSKVSNTVSNPWNRTVVILDLTIRVRLRSFATQKRVKSNLRAFMPIRHGKSFTCFHVSRLRPVINCHVPVDFPLPSTSRLSLFVSLHSIPVLSPARGPPLKRHLLRRQRQCNLHDL